MLQSSKVKFKGKEENIISVGRQHSVINIFCCSENAQTMFFHH